MAFTVSKSESSFTPPPQGMHVARCYRLIDLGTQPKTFQGQHKGEGRKIMVGWELLGDERMTDGRPFMINKSYFLSLHEKSSLRKDLESWRGRPFSGAEEAGFDVAKLIGAYCLLNIIQEQGQDGNEYTRISAITPMLKGMAKPDPVNDPVIFDLDSPDMELFEKFSDKMKDIIRNSREWKAKSAGSKPSTTASAPGAFADMDDDIPW